VRMRVLFEAAGVDVDDDIKVVVVSSSDQNRAFGEKEVDALYSHTPFLETALLNQGGILLVN